MTRGLAHARMNARLWGRGYGEAVTTNAAAATSGEATTYVRSTDGLRSDEWSNRIVIDEIRKLV